MFEETWQEFFPSLSKSELRSMSSTKEYRTIEVVTTAHGVYGRMPVVKRRRVAKTSKGADLRDRHVYMIRAGKCEWFLAEPVLKEML